MTRDCFIQLAHRRAVVRWSPSGKVEQLRVAKNGCVLAKTILTNREHRLSLIRDEYWCVEIDPRTPVRVGDLL